jgi:hypothetical protein
VHTEEDGEQSDVLFVRRWDRFGEHLVLSVVDPLLRWPPFLISSSSGHGDIGNVSSSACTYFQSLRGIVTAQTTATSVSTSISLQNMCANERGSPFT